MKTIHKFPVPLTDAIIAIVMPKGAKILTLQVQMGKSCIWAEVDTKAEPENRRFRWTGTGHEIPKGSAILPDYVGTVQTDGGAYVFHLYELLG
jgi:hypothetical protein